MAGEKDSVLRDELVMLLGGGNAHADFDTIIDDFPEELRGKNVKLIPCTAWQLLEHMRIAQWDIVDFSRNPDHESPEWPEGHWPKEKAPPSAKAWK